MRPRAVHQLLPALHPGDAVGNEALTLRAHLRDAGFDSDIFAAWIDPSLRGEARPLRECGLAAGSGVVLLYHFGCGSPATEVARGAAARLGIVYHNITPPAFFEPFDAALARQLRAGRDELVSLAGRAALALGKSVFSRRELDAMGFVSTGVLRYVHAPGLYDAAPAPVLRRLFSRERTNVIVVGRVAPNKCLEDVLGAFALYQRHYRGRSRLLLVGETRGQESYHHHLLHLARRLGLRDVCFTGHVTQTELVGCYSVADVLLSLSEHEGYGVPLVEGMRFGVPVVAFDAGAVAETLGGAGILLADKAPGVVAGVLDAVVSDRALRFAVLARQHRVAQEMLTRDTRADILESRGPLLD